MKTAPNAFVYYISSILVVVAAALQITDWKYTPYLFALGAAGVASFYLSSPYKGPNFRLRRFNRFNIFAGILLVVSSYFMFKENRAWIVTLFISAFLQLYVAFVSDKEKDS